MGVCLGWLFVLCVWGVFSVLLLFCSCFWGLNFWFDGLLVMGFEELGSFFFGWLMGCVVVCSGLSCRGFVFLFSFFWVCVIILFLFFGEFFGIGCRCVLGLFVFLFLVVLCCMVGGGVGFVCIGWWLLCVWLCWVGLLVWCVFVYALVGLGALVL